MKIVAALELIFWLLVLYAVARQLIAPLWNGEKIFPLLRKRRDLEVKLRDARTHLTDQELEQHLAALRAEAEKFREKNANTKHKPKS